MITSELLSYIKEQLSIGIDRSLIIEKLQASGWQQSEVEGAFSQLDVNNAPKKKVQSLGLNGS